ncbi:MAG: AAA family ATPase [Bryobacteraceae bacterium]
MSTQTNAAPPDALPPWARQLSEKYYSRTISMFILHGNVHDLVPWQRGGKTSFVPLPQFLNEGLFGRRELVLSYDRGGGIAFSSPDVQADFQRAITGYDTFHGTKYAQGLPRNPDGVLGILESYLRLRILDKKKIAVCISYADTIVPASDSSSMNPEDRNCLVILKRWAQNQTFLRADVTVCLITESLSALNAGLVQNPGVAAIEIPLPDERERIEFVRWQVDQTPLPPESTVTPQTLAKLGAGLKRVQLQNLIAHACENRQPLTIPFLTTLKKELIEAESGGLLEFIQTKYDLSMVAGHEPVKKKLRDAVAALRAGRFDVLPMGYVICGPVGTGKTFLTTCFAGEVGIPAVMLKNFRSMWQGVTEANLERVLTLLKAMSPISVVVDEADAQLGNRSSSGDSGVGNRVFAQIAQFMGNTEYRGKVIWFLLTCRPDLLPVDLKRQGRAEEHIALFYPHTDAERLAMFRAMQKKTGTRVATEEAEQFFLAHSGALSGADTEAVLVRARMKSALEGDSEVDVEDLKAAISDFIPPSYPNEIELQNLVAVLECTSKSLLPEIYRDMDRGEILRRVGELSLLSRF